MNSITTLSFLDELEKIAEEKKDSASRTTLKATAAGGAVGGAVGLSKGLHAAAHAPKVIGSGSEKLLLNPKETKTFKRLLVASGTGKGVAKGMQYGLMAGVAGGVAKKLLKKEKKKEASHTAELAGLGLLAAPSISHLRGKEWSEKNKARAEVGGLGVLAAPSAVAVGKKAVSKGKAVLRAANVKKIRDAAVGVAKHAGVKDVAKRIYHSDKALHRTEGFAAGTLFAVGAKALGDKLKKREDRLKKEKVAVSDEWIIRHASQGAKKRVQEGKSAFKNTPLRSQPRSHKQWDSYLAGSRLGERLAKDSAKEAKSVKKAKGVAAAVGLTAAGLYAGKKLYDRAKSKKKEAAPSMSAMMNMHRLADAAKSAKSVAKPAAQAVKLPTQATHAVRAQQFSGHTATGGHAWNPATQAKRAIPL